MADQHLAKGPSDVVRMWLNTLGRGSQATAAIASPTVVVGM
jgi:hypothetical protein